MKNNKSQDSGVGKKNGIDHILKKTVCVLYCMIKIMRNTKERPYLVVYIVDIIQFESSLLI